MWMAVCTACGVFLLGVVGIFAGRSFVLAVFAIRLPPRRPAYQRGFCFLLTVVNGKSGPQTSGISTVWDLAKHEEPPGPTQPT